MARTAVKTDEPMTDRDYPGSCHCGAIGFVYGCAQDPETWSIRACQCTFCRAHDALSASEPAATIEFRVTRDSDLQRYRFGLKTADFLLCRNCGVYIGAFIATDKGSFGIINTHALAHIPENMGQATAAVYDDEEPGNRIERRIERWAPATITIAA